MYVTHFSINFLSSQMITSQRRDQGNVYYLLFPFNSILKTVKQLLSNLWKLITRIFHWFTISDVIISGDQNESEMLPKETGFSDYKFVS